MTDIPPRALDADGDGTPDYTPDKQGGTPPVITAAAVAAVVSAVLGVLVAFGVPLTELQVGAILTLVAAVGPLVVGWIGSRTTVEYVSHGEVVRGQANEGPTGQVVRPLGTLTIH